MHVKMLRTAALVAALASVAVTAVAAPPAAKSAAPAAGAPAAGDDPVVARVNGKEIHRSEVISALQQLPAQAQQMKLEDLYPRILENMIAAKLAQDAGYKEKLQDTKDVKAQLKEDEARLVENAYIVKQVEARMTDALLQQKYNEYVKAHPSEEEVRARHILVKTEDEAKDLIKKINGGADFAKLASEQQIDKASAAQAGDLGYFVKGEMVAPFADAAFAMKPGEVSKTPVKTDFGWHVIKVEDRRMRQPPTFEQAKPQLRQAVGQELARQVVEDLRKSAKIEAFDITGKQPLQMVAPGTAPAAK